MNIDDAACSLVEHLNDDETFIVSVQDGCIRIDVNYIYRMEDAMRVGKVWEGFPVVIGRKSCW